MANEGAPATDALLEAAPDAVIFSDLEGTIRVWNAAAERIFGFTAAEAIGANLDIIIPERFREAHWTGFERAMADRITKYVGRALPTRALTSDGNQIYVELAFAVIVSDGRALGALATARDITERFEQDRALRRELTELRERLGSEPR